MGARRHGQGGHLPPGNVKCFVHDIKTPSRPIIYALFSQFFVTPGPSWRTFVSRPPNLLTPGKSPAGVHVLNIYGYTLRLCVCRSELTIGHILWPVTHITNQSADPWPVWPVTRDPVPDHGMSRSRLLTNHDEFTTIAFYSLQSGINVMCDWVLLIK